ncbi:phosphoesterase family-domain-containing protein [Aspergillus pseudodeflectus]|uniref:Phosphoesterase family-domain-containing protein n=1 Tax=Aspergillus pseudodeflectus TaxID=176178 RepID=A0ABR4L4U9_9EURO
MNWLRGSPAEREPRVDEDQEPLLNEDEHSRRSSQDEESTTLQVARKTTSRRRFIVLGVLLTTSITSIVVVIVLLATHTLFPKPEDRTHRIHHSPIKNIVVLVQENLAFDTIAGGLTYNPDIDNLVNHTFCNPVNVSDPDSPQICAKPIAKNIAADDPDHSIAGGNQQVYGTDHPDLSIHTPSMQGFVTEQMRAHGITSDLSRAAEVINYYTPEHVPVFNALAENFLLFDRWFASVPGPTNPNRAYLTSGTSHGHGFNDPGFDVSALPQLSIFEQLSAANISWINYSNATGFAPDALFYHWTATNARQNIKPIYDFYADAREGNLPQFTWINPECCSYTSFHPPSPINLGEDFVKSIYEALRAGPQWNETLFILTFDEHGGFADHVPPPENVPPGDNIPYTEVAGDGKPTTFHFDRLGIRVPTILISPWVEKGAVVHAPKNGKGEYTHTSILKYVAELWGLEILGPRVEWSASFKDLIHKKKKKFRDDTPVVLPNPAVF